LLVSMLTAKPESVGALQQGDVTNSS